MSYSICKPVNLLIVFYWSFDKRISRLNISSYRSIINAFYYIIIKLYTIFSCLLSSILIFWVNEFSRFIFKLHLLIYFFKFIWNWCKNIILTLFWTKILYSYKFDKINNIIYNFPTTLESFITIYFNIHINNQ